MTNVVYDTIGVGYARYRQPDHRIAAAVAAALGPARSVLNVGAGAGSYEPSDRDLVAVEPSAEMVRQRSPSAAPAIRGVAELLPLRDRCFDAAMAILTIHHWPDWRRGLLEMRRVARDRIVVLTWDPASGGFWLTDDYFPEILLIDRRILPRIDEISQLLGPLEVRPVAIPHDCTDGFLGAYWRRPERYLDANARRAISTFAKIPELEGGLARLTADLQSGDWRDRHRLLLDLPELDLGYRILIGRAGGRRRSRAG